MRHKGLVARGPMRSGSNTNCLELLTAMLALQTFVKSATGVSILLRLDNSTAVAYINKLGRWSQSLIEESMSGAKHTDSSPIPPRVQEQDSRRESRTLRD